MGKKEEQTYQMPEIHQRERLKKNGEPVKALAMLSGGLDSILSIKYLLLLGFHVEAFHFVNPFIGCTKYGDVSEHILKCVEELNIPLHVSNQTDNVLKAILKPKHGLGKNINPCIDCRMNGIRSAFQLLEEKGFDFIFTGEVMGQRPMSQNKSAMETVAKELGFGDRILRPLCGKFFPVSLPEAEGWIDRNELLDLKGRTRKPQMKMAREWGIKNYESPSGGCLLTDKMYPHKFSRLMEIRYGINEYTKEHGYDLEIEDMETSNISYNDLLLLRFGRHHNVGNSLLVCGRDHDENILLHHLASMRNDELPASRGLSLPDILVESSGVGATVLLRGYSDELKELIDSFENGKYLAEIDDLPQLSVEDIKDEAFKVACEEALYHSKQRQDSGDVIVRLASKMGDSYEKKIYLVKITGCQSKRHF
eukprot:TRINITY_DN2394_c0_g2_i1.p1 TRINITY_DN2394_c0_g2~~TRINITY_DN2394_c0_g2_i1.p1  ORF type:complete len:433 (+),score=131.67 TRINITY_DN2394_c0_g2_i1:35-1300(+)